MSCYLCGSGFIRHNHVLSPDKYMKLIGKEYSRVWKCCDRCGLWYQEHRLTQDDLKSIYIKYRDHEMRATTVKNEFLRIQSIPDNENTVRIKLLEQSALSRMIKGGSALDIGSGLGIVPYSLKNYFNQVDGIEPEMESAEFMREELGINCYEGFYPETRPKKRYDLISIVHLLEHVRDPVYFLMQAAGNMEDNGILYIEVPDASEFNYLVFDHDEFNSTHLWFFNPSTLYRTIRKAGFEPFQINLLKYQERRLTRTAALSRLSKPF